MKTVTARGLVNGRGPNRRFGRDSVFKRNIFPLFVYNGIKFLIFALY